jgi:ATP-dependent Clp protease protease subunit
MSKLYSSETFALFYNENINLPTRTLYLGYGSEEDDVDRTLASNIIKGLHLLEASNSSSPINIILNCLGGDVGHGLAIYDSIKACSSPVTITVTGHAYSMGAWILQAGDVRRMHKHSSIMIHDGDKAVWGRAQDAKNWHHFYQEQDEVCITILLNRIRDKHPSFSKAKLLKLLEKDTILWPSQALKLGLIDEVIE